MKLPENAKRVFKGIIYDVYHWDQTVFDGSTETYEMLKRPDTVQSILIEGESIILAKEEQPHKGTFYTLIGGRAEEGEEPLEGMKRELLEETGMEAASFSLFNTYEPATKIDWRVFIYLAHNLKEVQESRLDAGEKIELIRCSFDEFIEIVLSEEFRGREFAYDFCRRLYRGEKEDLRKKLFIL